ncbi:MAG: NAD(P)H-binding protein, partial [Propionibacterium sp.]
VKGDLTDAATLTDAVDGVDAIIFVHGTHGEASGYEDVDYGGVLNVLTVVGSRRVRISLMTAIGVTDHAGSYNRSTGAHDWKRRSERLVRASGHPYTIVRPGWFDYNDADQHQLVFLQGDTRHAGSPADGVVARCQIAQVLVSSLTSDAANRKTIELVAEPGPAQTDFDPLFAALEGDTSVDGIHDADSLPLRDEPARVRADLEKTQERE